MDREELSERVFALERDLSRLDDKLDKLLEKLGRQGDGLQTLEDSLTRLHQGEEALRQAIGLSPDAGTGDRGFLDEMDDSILRLEDYLLALGERVQRVLLMLQDHKALLDDVNDSVAGQSQRDRLRLELDIMMNAISILAIAGVEIDPAIPAELDELRHAVREDQAEVEALQQRKMALDLRLAGEVKRYDLAQLYAGRKQLPGYG